MKQTYFFPLSFLIPNFEGETINVGQFSLRKRRWDTSTFDFATLATKHKLHLPYQLMDVLIGKCNCELAIAGKDTFEAAADTFQSFRLGLYLQGVSPFLVPYSTTESINDYSGVNERDSAISRGVLPKIESAFSSHNHELEAWPMELTTQCMVIPSAFGLSSQKIESAVAFAQAWGELASDNPTLQVVTRTSASAVVLGSYEQSILHIWTAIEALFKSVSSEVNFRLSLYLTQLCAEGEARKVFHSNAKSAYNIRSKIAHGASKKVTFEQWKQAWDLLLASVSAIEKRGRLPNEEDLLDELLSAST
nr:HEPN domain-containing protein [Halomonas sp. UBA3074]